MGSQTELPTVLVVCTGNVCRSPYLERRLQSELDSSWGRGEITVRSAGTGALVGHPMDPGSLSRLATSGIDGRDFIARAVTKDLVAGACLIITAERRHRQSVTRLHPRSLKTTHALKDLAQLAREINLPATTPTDPAEWLPRVARLLAARRGVTPPLPPEQADVIDPYRRDDAAFDQMGRQIEDALPHLLRVLGRPGAA